MKCVQCGGTMTTKRETVPYTSSGLPGITLHGVEVSRCKACGEYEVSIPRIEQLHRMIAASVAKKPARLTPEEIRFLRKYLGLSGADLAHRMGVRGEAISRWENAREPMSEMAERLLRLMVATDAPVKDYSTELFDDIADEERPLKVDVADKGKTWELAVA